MRGAVLSHSPSQAKWDETAVPLCPQELTAQPLDLLQTLVGQPPTACRAAELHSTCWTAPHPVRTLAHVALGGAEAPTLHRLLSSPSLKSGPFTAAASDLEGPCRAPLALRPYITGGKGVGSQGDGPTLGSPTAGRSEKWRSAWGGTMHTCLRQCPACLQKRGGSGRGTNDSSQFKHSQGC